LVSNVKSRTEHDPIVIELMKLSALAEVQKRPERGNPGNQYKFIDTMLDFILIDFKSALIGSTISLSLAALNRFSSAIPAQRLF
jgi:hypothetical protein